MLHVSTRFTTSLVAFAPVFVQTQTWRCAQLLLLEVLDGCEWRGPQPPEQTSLLGL
jgi:hypothetical protein